MISIFNKQPSEKLDYDVDLFRYLPSTDYPVSAVAASTPSGLTLGITAFNATTKMVKQWISSGVDGQTYKVTLTITTSEGRIKEVDFNIKVKEL